MIKVQYEVKYYSCEHCHQHFDYEEVCLAHEKCCAKNQEWEMVFRPCGTGCWYHQNDMCGWNEHCDGQYSVYINKITGEERHTLYL